MSLDLSDEPVNVLSNLQEAIQALEFNHQSRIYFDMLNQELSVLHPQLLNSIQSMKEEAAFGQTLKQSQLKGLQVGTCKPIASTCSHFITISSTCQEEPFQLVLVESRTACSLVNMHYQDRHKADHVIYAKLSPAQCQGCIWCQSGQTQDVLSVMCVARIRPKTARQSEKIQTPADLHSTSNIR